MRPLYLLLVLSFCSVAHAQTNGGTPPAPAAPAAAAPATTTATTPAPSAADIAQAANARALGEITQMIRSGDFDGAMVKVNPIIQADPRNITAYILRGQIYTHQKALDKAANDFQSAHLIDPANPIANFDLAESKFTQKSYDAARIGFAELAKDPTTFIGDLAAYKVYLCDLLGNHPDVAAKELDAFNKTESHPSYYYSNAAFALVNHKPEDARGWLASAARIYTPQKNSLYAKSLSDLGFLPLPPPPPAQ